MSRVPEGPVRSIVAPVDESPSSRRAVRLAAEMAVGFRARLVLLHVVALRELPALIGEVEDPRADENAQLVLGEAARIAVEAGAQPRVEVRRGHVVSQILRFVRTERPDLLVMGSRGLRGAKRVLLGSVSGAVSRRAPCAVLLVR